MTRTRLVISVAVVIIAAVAVSSAQEQAKRGPSTPEERAAVVAFAQRYVQDPLNKDLFEERARLVKVMEGVPDIHVGICAEGMAWLAKKYKYSGELTSAYLLGNSAYVIRQMESGRDRNDAAAHLAGLDAAIRTYQSIVSREPKARWKEMDQLVGKQQSGELQKMTFCGNSGA